MKILVVILALFCGTESVAQSWYDDKGRTIIGKWEKLTILNQKDSVLYSNNYSRNAKIIVDKNKMQIYILYGQEEVTYVIDEIKFVKDEFLIILHIIDDELKSKIKMKCKIIDRAIAYWDYFGDGHYTINGKYNIFTNSPEKYKTVYEDLDE